MTHPLSEIRKLSRFIVTGLGFRIDLSDTMERGGVLFSRHVTPDGKGGGFVAATSYVPPTVAVPWDCVVFEETRVLDNADFVSAGTRISGNVYKVSHILRPDERYLLLEAAEYRAWVRSQWDVDLSIVPRAV